MDVPVIAGGGERGRCRWYVSAADEKEMEQSLTSGFWYVTCCTVILYLVCMDELYDECMDLRCCCFACDSCSAFYVVAPSAYRTRRGDH